MNYTDAVQEVEPGDWIRFYQNGELVIGVVEYIQKDLIGHWQLKTNIGSVDSRYVLEVRAKQ